MVVIKNVFFINENVKTWLQDENNPRRQKGKYQSMTRKPQGKPSDYQANLSPSFLFLLNSRLSPLLKTKSNLTLLSKKKGNCLPTLPLQYCSPKTNSKYPNLLQELPTLCSYFTWLFIANLECMGDEATADSMGAWGVGES